MGGKNFSFSFTLITNSPLDDKFPSSAMRRQVGAEQEIFLVAKGKHSRRMEIKSLFFPSFSSRE
jgi:hypothetical protein